MPTREERLAALLAQPERAIEAEQVVPGLLQEVSIEELESRVQAMWVKHSPNTKNLKI